ncbi:MAG: LytTR family DNA-binding domain-containing protein [Saprospiraceae bacterium]
MNLPALPCTTKWRPHLWLAAIIGLWLVAFLVVAAPFDTSELTFKNRLLLLSPYGIIFMLAYLPNVALQNLIFRKTERWTVLAEAGIVLLSYTLALLMCFAYYRSDWLNGQANFSQFVASIFLPTVLLLSFLLISGRWFISRGQKVIERIREPELIALRGDNRTDVIRLLPEQLICISGAQNYAEVHYLVDGKPQKQLLRTTLSNVASQAPALLRVHRSHLVNPLHFVRWVGTTGALFHATEIPVSKTYRPGLVIALDLDAATRPTEG